MARVACFLLLLAGVLSVCSLSLGSPVPEWTLVGSTTLGVLPYVTSSEGVASLDDKFYFNSRQFISVVDAVEYQVTEPGVSELAIPRELRNMGYDHLGDGDIFDGLFYNCLERQHYDTYTNATLLTYNATDLQYTGQYAQTEQMHMPWVAVNGDTAEVWSSDWSPVNFLYVYDARNLTQLRTVDLSIEISEPQGGGFYEGLLYVACNDDMVYVFDPSDGLLLSSFPTGFSAEMEGLTFMDLHSSGQGRLHILDGNVATPWKGSHHKLYHYDYDMSL